MHIKIKGTAKYIRIKGWKSDISNAKSLNDLPENAKIYLKKLEELVGIPIKIISVGADREQTIILENPFK